MIPMLHSLYKNTKLEGILAEHRNRDRKYLKSLTDENLLLPYQLEAGRRRITYMPKDLHDGWDSPLSQIRGTVCGHWLSAVAQLCSEEDDPELYLRANRIVAEIALCQEDNGGEWCFPIPEKYLYWLKKGKRTWAPHYVCHKTMMGLLDMYRYLGNQQALEIVERASHWFLRYTEDITPDQMKEILWEETGGMMELWADLYAVTGNPQHLTLMRRYERRELFDLLESGEDPLTNMHANTTIPEIHGAARAYEVTGEERYRRLVESYWNISVEKAVPFVTGGQGSGEVWTPPGQHSARLGPMTQEHCTVYNMMRLAEYLFRWTGESKYADYWEKNLYNGILAQGFWEEFGCNQIGSDELAPRAGYVAYYLPLHAGAKKVWGSATGDFWCCHCTLMQANVHFPQALYYQQQNTIFISEYFDSSVSFHVDDTKIHLSLYNDPEGGETIRILPDSRNHYSRPPYQKVVIKIQAEQPVHFALALRIPAWVSGSAVCTIDGDPVSINTGPSGFCTIDRNWDSQAISLILPKSISVYPLPDRPDTVAFLDGPVALAGMTCEERTLYYTSSPEEILIPDDERIWDSWKPGWRTTGQPVNITFRPLYDIFDEPYTTYFPIRKIKKEEAPLDE